MYQDNVLYVRIQDQLTYAFKPKICVRQGDIGPIFFKIFLNDLLDILRKEKTKSSLTIILSVHCCMQIISCYYQLLKLDL